MRKRPIGIERLHLARPAMVRRVAALATSASTGLVPVPGRPAAPPYEPAGFSPQAVAKYRCRCSTKDDDPGYGGVHAS